MKIYYPLKNPPKIGNGYGPRKSFRLPDGQWTLPFHYGVDWAVPEGTPIYATHDGTITVNSWDHTRYGGGNQVQITNGAWSTWYLHMKAPSHLKIGTKIKAGQLIGYVGNTGASTGAHLHFELHKNGKPVDPVKHFQEDELTPAEKRMLKEIHAMLKAAPKDNAQAFLDTSIDQLGGYRGTKITLRNLFARQSHQFGVLRSRTSKLMKKLGVK